MAMSVYALTAIEWSIVYRRYCRYSAEQLNHDASATRLKKTILFAPGRDHQSQPATIPEKPVFLTLSTGAPSLQLQIRSKSRLT